MNIIFIICNETIACIIMLAYINNSVNTVYIINSNSRMHNMHNINMLFINNILLYSEY